MLSACAFPTIYTLPVTITRPQNRTCSLGGIDPLRSAFAPTACGPSFLRGEPVAAPRTFDGRGAPTERSHRRARGQRRPIRQRDPRQSVNEFSSRVPRSKRRCWIKLGSRATAGATKRRRRRNVRTSIRYPCAYTTALCPPTSKASLQTDFWRPATPRRFAEAHAVICACDRESGFREWSLVGTSSSSCEGGLATSGRPHTSPTRISSLNGYSISRPAWDGSLERGRTNRDGRFTHTFWLCD